MSKQLFLPESMYNIDSKMNRQKLVVSFKKQTTITGKIIRLNSKDKLFEVDLGGNLIGILPFELSTIYPIYKDNGSFGYGFISLVGKTIQAKIIKYDNNNIVLSRKEIMLEALEELKNTTKVKFAAITSFSHTSAFVDIGAGIIGKCTTSNYANAVFINAEDVGFRKGDVVQATIAMFQPELNCFDISIANNFPEVKEELNVGDVVICKVFGSLGDNVGYYVLIDNKYSGIVDSPFYRLQYGDVVSGVINKFGANGVKLRMLEVLEKL